MEETRVWLLLTRQLLSAGLNTLPAGKRPIILYGIFSYNLGQNKKEQLTPSSPKARRSKNAPFWRGWRGGPDVPFILCEIVDWKRKLLTMRVFRLTYYG